MQDYLKSVGICGLRHVNLEITSGCNQRCFYCFNDSGRVRPGELTTEQWMEIIDSLWAAGARSTLVTGGEPFVRKDIWSLLEYLQLKGLDTSILSNGYRLRSDLPEQCQKILKKLRRAQISLDSATPDLHNQRRGREWAWSTAMTAISWLRSLDVNVEISATISPETVNELDSIAQIASQCRSKVLIRPLANVGRGRNLDQESNLNSSIEKERRVLEEKYGDIFVDDFACYAPVIPQIDQIAASNGILTIQSNGTIRGGTRQIIKVAMSQHVSSTCNPSIIPLMNVQSFPHDFVPLKLSIN